MGQMGPMRRIRPIGPMCPIGVRWVVSPGLNGWQRQMRHRPFGTPRHGPYFRTARIMYSLHPGW